MQVVKTIKAWRSIKQQFPKEQSIGFLATMGCLHDGHGSLIKQAREHNDIVIVSIFVNPTQFNDKADYDNYPRTIEHDIALLEKLKVDYLFLPTAEEMYPEGDIFSLSTSAEISRLFEGEYRPGHFTGMLTIVSKLFLALQPTHSYWGEKDYQQAALVKKMVDNFFLPITIIICPTYRETSFLPFSSRNSRLNQNQRQIAEQAWQQLKQANTASLDFIKEKLIHLGCDIDYLEQYNNRIFVALHIGSVRLIDNF